MLKKFGMVLLALMLVSTLILVGCGGGSSKDDPDTPEGAEWEEFWKLSDYLAVEENRNWGSEAVLPLQKAGSPTFTVEESGITVSDRTADWNALDLRVDSANDNPLHLDFSAKKFKIVVTGYAIDTPAAPVKMKLALPDSPYTTLDDQAMEEGDEVPFELEYVFPATYRMNRIRVQTDGGSEHYAYKVTEIIIYSLEETIPFVAVTDITGVPATVYKGQTITLTGTVVPTNANNVNITWSITEQNPDDIAELGTDENANKLTANDLGTITVTATIANGTAVGTAFTKDFEIEIENVPANPAPIIAVNFSGASETEANPLEQIGATPSSDGSSITMTVPNGNQWGKLISVNVDFGSAKLVDYKEVQWTIEVDDDIYGKSPRIAVGGYPDGDNGIIDWDSITGNVNLKGEHTFALTLTDVQKELTGELEIVFGLNSSDFGEYTISNMKFIPWIEE